METVVAKIISMPDIEYMYDNENRPGTCPICHNTLEKIPDVHYKVEKKRADILCTYDGYCIVTEKFKEFCNENKYPNITFIALTDSIGYYFFMPHDIYKLDYIHRKTQFLNKRECCGSYDEIIGATPAYKLSSFSTESDDFINRSEYLFGTKGCKDPLIIIGLKTQQKMKAFGLKGIDYKNVYSIEMTYGKPKPMEDVTLQDMQKNPIWIFALDEEENEEIDETWQKPVLNYDNVTYELVEAYILMKSSDGQYDVSANLDIEEETLDDVTYWDSEQECWIPIENIGNYKELQFVAIPKIEKEADVVFGFDETKNRFSSVRSQAQPKKKRKGVFSFFASLFKRK